MICGNVTLFCLFYILLYVLNLFSCEKKGYMIVEHARVTYVNPAHLANFTLVTRRYSRRDRTRYLNVYAQSLREFNSKYSVYFDFYELVYTTYKRTYADLHFDNFCDLIEKDTFLGSMIVNAYLKSTPKEKQLKNIACPIPPGEYMSVNMTIPQNPILTTFPYAKGRVYCNATYQKKELALSFHVDLTSI